MDIEDRHLRGVFWTRHVCARWKSKVGRVDNEFWWVGKRAFNTSFVFGWVAGYICRVRCVDKANPYHPAMGSVMDDMDGFYAHTPIYW